MHACHYQPERKNSNKSFLREQILLAVVLLGYGNDWKWKHHMSGSLKGSWLLGITKKGTCHQGRRVASFSRFSLHSCSTMKNQWQPGSAGCLSFRLTSNFQRIKALLLIDSFAWGLAWLPEAHTPIGQFAIIHDFLGNGRVSHI
jgi:hypothetical protein